MSKKRIRLLCVGVVAISAAIFGSWVYAEHQENNYRYHAVDKGVLYRCRQFDPLDIEGASRRHIKQIINLRTVKEYKDPSVLEREISACKFAGIEYVNIPVPGLPSDEQVLEFLRYVLKRNPSLGAVMVHCEHGRTRTGVMIAAYRIVVENWSTKRALDEVESYFPDGDNGDEDQMRPQLERIHKDRKQWLLRAKA